MRIRAIGWDLDGTLAESESLAMPIAVIAAAEYVQQKKAGVVILQPERDAFVQKLMGKTITEIGEAVGDAYGVKMPHDLQDRVTARTIKTLAEQCAPIPGAISVVRDIRAAGIAQWIATSSAPERVEPTLKATGLGKEFVRQEWDWFSARQTKPNPEVYLRSIATRGFKPDVVMAVEDSPTGVKAAVAAGIKHIVAFTGGAHIPEARKQSHLQLLIEAGATHAVSSLQQLPGLIAVVNQQPTRSTGGGQPLSRARLET